MIQEKSTNSEHWQSPAFISDAELRWETMHYSYATDFTPDRYLSLLAAPLIPSCLIDKPVEYSLIQ